MEKVYQKDNQFYLQEEFLPEIPLNQKYKLIATSEFTTIIITDKENIYRFRKGIDNALIKYDLPPAPVTGYKRLDKIAGTMSKLI